MTIINLPKAIGDIQEAQLLPEDYYVMKITQEPTIEPNAEMKKQEAGESFNEDKAGHNLVLRLRVEHDDPMINGRQFTKWLSLPKEGDESRVIESTGQTIQDFKLEQLSKWYEALSGQVADPSMESLSFEVGQRCAVHVETGEDFRTHEAVSQINFNKDPKPVLG